MVARGGFEPSTLRVWTECSSQLSYSASKDETNDVCKNIINNYGIDLVTLNTMETIDGGITNSNENYITIMNNNLDLLNKELYK